MILPVYAYGQPVLKMEAEDIDQNYEDLDTLIANMWETMYAASGVGLAAPQIGEGVRLFIVDTIQVLEKEDQETGIKKVFVNAHKIEELGEVWAYEEGCLSIPHIRADVNRQESITLEYYDERWQKHVETFSGINARVIQHEYDHIDGVLFIDHLKPLKKKLLKRKLEAIKKGLVESDYRMKFKSIK